MGTQTLVVGNWKMNLTIHEASLYVHQLDKVLKNHRDVEVVLAPGFLALPTLALQVNHRKFKLAAQNFYWRDSGAYTGEVSAHQLHGLVKYALVGHSERRHVFGENERETGRKVQAALRSDIKPILCVGETVFERSEGETSEVIHDQLLAGLYNITSEDMANVVIAYEPVWAISNGKNFSAHAVATPEDASEAARIIRRQITHLFGKKVADATPVIYGGSVTADNATGFFTAKGIDGVLPGGASLHLEQFASIVAQAHEANNGKSKGE